MNNGPSDSTRLGPGAIAPPRSAAATASRGLVMPASLFTLLAILLFLFLILLGFVVVVAIVYLGSESSSAHRTLDRGWAVISALALLWALANLHWSRQAASRSNATAIYGHLAMAIGCGLIALGIHSVLFARAIGSQPVLMDFSQSSHRGRAAGSSASAVALPQGDAEQGRKIFSTTCITCHGPAGGGLPNLAPSLRGSEFIASADDVAVGSVIRLGRAVADPSNKSKKVMPARGGNPFLGDDKIVHLVAFIRAVQKEGGDGSAAAADKDAAPPVQLAKWVVPAGPPPPSGMISLEKSKNLGDKKSLERRSQERRESLLQSLTLGLAGTHALFLLGVMIVSSDVLIRRLKDDASPGVKSWWKLSSLGWIVATLAWLVVLLMGFDWM